MLVFAVHSHITPQNSLELLCSCLDFLNVTIKGVRLSAWLWCALSRHRKGAITMVRSQQKTPPDDKNLRTNVPSTVWHSGLAWQLIQQLPGRNVGIIARGLCCIWENNEETRSFYGHHDTFLPRQTLRLGQAPEAGCIQLWRCRLREPLGSSG